MRARASWSPAYSADGLHLAFLVGGRRRTCVRLLDLQRRRDLPVGDRGEVTQVAWPREPRPVGPAWVEDGQVLAVRSCCGRCVRTTAPGGVQDLSIECWTGGTVWCTAGVTGTASRVLLAHDPATRHWRRSLEVPAGLVVADVSDDGRALLTLAHEGRLQAQVATATVHDGGVGTPVVLTEAGLPGEVVAAVGWGADQRSALVVGNPGRETRALLSVDAGGLRVVRGRPAAELESVTTTPDRTHALLVWNSAGRSELEVLDLVTDTTEMTGRPPGDVVYGADLRPDARRLAVSVTGVDVPPHVAQVVVPDGRSSLVQPAPVRRRRSRHRTDLVETVGSDGLALTGWLYRPARPSGRCVLSMHGGPDDQERPSFNPLHQALLTRGLTVLAPNVRGSRGFGRTFSAADDRGGRFGARGDVLSFARLAQERDWGHRLGVLGVSYGGYLALCALQDAPELFVCGATVSGVVDLADYVRTTEGWRRPVAAAEFGDPDADAELLAALSPLPGLAATIAPLLIVHGADDRVVPAEHAVDLARRLRSAGRRPRLRLVPGRGHALVTPGGAVPRQVARWFATRLSAPRPN